MWADVDQLPVYRANQFLLQVEPGADGEAVGTILTLGQVSPPVLFGTPEEQAAAAMALGAVVTKPIVRLSVEIGSLRQFALAVQQHVAIIDGQLGGEPTS